MKKLIMHLSECHILLLLPLTLFTYTFSFIQTIITGNASNTRMAWPGWHFRSGECSAYRDQ